MALTATAANAAYVNNMNELTTSVQERTSTLICRSSGERVDVFLACNLSGITRSAAHKLINAGRVMRDGVPVRKNHRTKPGEIYTVRQDEPLDPVALPQDIPLVVVFEDIDIIIVDKPRGMVVHPAPGHPDGTLVNALLAHCGGSLSGIGGVKRPGIVHRIDKDTSGLIIAAKNDKSHLALAAQLSSRTLTREYSAVVRGAVKADTGTVDAPIGRDPKNRKRQAVTDKFSRPAVTHYEVTARYARYTQICCKLETGRTHQIRVHMAHIGHPILGDTVYGYKKPELGMSSQCLHARKLCFIHPSTNEHIELCADMPQYFMDVISKLSSMA